MFDTSHLVTDALEVFPGIHKASTLVDTRRANSVGTTLGVGQAIDPDKITRHKRDNDHLAHTRTLGKKHGVTAEIDQRCVHLAAVSAVNDAYAVAQRHAVVSAEAGAREDQAEVDEACVLLYGADNRGGLAKLKGNRYADALCMAYLQAMPWDEIADVMQCSRQWCRELCNVGFRYIDEVGFAALKDI